ncbi:Serine/threonine kinase [Gonapodya sp. JEL0774]|nr:Serine/threonine kinase [Gonapodya sp. JEL0774]
MQLVDQINRERAAKKRAEEARVAREEEQKRLREYEQEREEELKKARKLAEEAEARLIAEMDARKKAEAEQMRLEEQIKIAKESKQQEVQHLQESLVLVKQRRSKGEEEQEEARRQLEEAKQMEADEKKRLTALIDLQKQLAQEAKLKALDRQARAAAITATLNAAANAEAPMVVSPVEVHESPQSSQPKPTQLPTVNFPQPSTPSVASTPVSSPHVTVPVRKSSAIHKPKVSAEDFHFLKVLGRGAYGKVMMAEEKATGQTFAVKVLKKSGCLQPEELEALMTEKNLFVLGTRDRFPFLVTLHSCFQTENHIYFVQEFLSGGDLMWHIQHAPNGRFSEARAKYYAAEVLLALQFFHQKNVVYRDLKLENILMTNQGHIKLADYGICKENCGPEDQTTTMCGTAQPYGKSVDWWSFGVLLFQMLTGRSPFHGESDEEVFAAVVNDPLAFPMEVPLSRMAMGLIRRLLEKDPARRLGSGPADAFILMKHPWFADVDFEKMSRLEVPPPFVPELKSAKDASNFDDAFTGENPVLTPPTSSLSKREQDMFLGFSYVSDWVIERRREGLGVNAGPGVAPFQ